MRIYAERPGRAALQLLADIGAVVWVLLVVHVARAAQAGVLALQTPAQRLEGAGGSIHDAFDRAASTASGVPFVGDDLARALGTGTDAGTSLASSGREIGATVATAGSAVGLAVALVGVVPVVLVWLALRGHWVRAARSARVARAADPDLLALHALTRRSTGSLLQVAPNPAEGWRRGDPAVVAALAGVELAALGLRAPVTPRR